MIDVLQMKRSLSWHLQATLILKILGHVQTHVFVFVWFIICTSIHISRSHSGLGAIPDKSTALQILAEVKSGSKSLAAASRGLVEQIFPFLLYLKVVFLCWAVNNESSWHYTCRGVGGILKERWGSRQTRAQQEKQLQ